MRALCQSTRALQRLACAALQLESAASKPAVLLSLRCFATELEVGAILGSKKKEVVGAYTPATKKLWLQRYQWTPEMLRSMPPQDELTPRPPTRTTVTYPFRADMLLREHYRSPWDTVRIGRILEDLDSLAGYIAHEHSETPDHSRRPPLLVTATVEAIELRSSSMVLDQDLRMSGRVVWTGRSSMDICMELEQEGRKQLVALFTFVARDAFTGKAHPVNPVAPESEEDRALFTQRQAVADARRAVREAQKGEELHHVGSREQEAFAAGLLAESVTKKKLPALADGNSLLMDQTAMSNTFTCQPQQRNLHGRIFGGFLMRRALELAHSTAYLFAGTRPQTVSVDDITFKRAVEVGDLISFQSVVLHTWQCPANPSQGAAHVQVEAVVMKPEQRASYTSNVFNFEFQFELKRDPAGNPIPPKRVLPNTEAQAAEVARFYGPEADSTSNAFLKLL